MMSKNWFFKFIIEDWKRRLWAIALVSLLFFFSFPVATVFMSGNRYAQDPYWLKSFSNVMFSMVSKSNGWTATVIVTLSLVCGASGFSWLDSKKKVDFYHSLPIRREKLFIVNYMNGILIPAVPYFIFLMIAAGIAVAQGVSPNLFQTALIGWCYFMVYYLLLYSTVVIAVIMTGNLIVGFLGVGVFFFYGPLALVVAESYFDTWFYTYSGEDIFINYAKYLSPFINFCIGSSVTWGFVLSRLAAGVVLSLAAFFLYRKRPSEAAGKAMAFSVSKPVIRVLLVMAFSLLGAVFLWGMRQNIGWSIFGLAAVGMITHCIIEIIYNFDFKKLFSHYRQMLACFAVSLFILFGFRYDIFGYDRYIPKEENVAFAAVAINRLDDWVEYGEMRPNSPSNGEDEDRALIQAAGVWSTEEEAPYRWVYRGSGDYIFQTMKLSDKAAVLDIAREGIKETQERRRREMKPTAMWEEDVETDETEKFYMVVSVQYTLRSGKTARREYTIDRSKIDDSVIRIFNSREYKEGVYPVLAMEKDQVAEVDFERIGRTAEISGQEKAGQLLEAYQKDLIAMKNTDIDGQLPIGTIRFVTKEEKILEDWANEQNRRNSSYYRSYHTGASYPVYESFTNVLDALAQENINLDHPLTTEQVKGLVLSDGRSYEENGLWVSGESVRIEDADELEELLPLFSPDWYLGYNYYFNKDKTYLDGELYFLSTERPEEYQEGEIAQYSVDYDTYIADKDDIPPKYMDRISYDEMTEKIEAGKTSEAAN